VWIDLHARDPADDPTDGAENVSEFQVVSPNDLQVVSSSAVAAHVHDDPSFFDTSTSSRTTSSTNKSKNIKSTYPM